MMALIRGLQGAAPCPICLVPQNMQSKLGVEPLYVTSRSRYLSKISMTTNAGLITLAYVRLLMWKLR